MSKKKAVKKKAVKKSTPVVKEDDSYVKLTEDQFSKIYDYFNYENSISELDRIKSLSSDATTIEISYLVGTIKQLLESEMGEMTKFLDEIKPEEVDDFSFDDYDDDSSDEDDDN